MRCDVVACRDHKTRSRDAKTDRTRGESDVSRFFPSCSHKKSPTTVFVLFCRKTPLNRMFSLSLSLSDSIHYASIPLSPIALLPVIILYFKCFHFTMSPPSIHPHRDTDTRLSHSVADRFSGRSPVGPASSRESKTSCSRRWTSSQTQTKSLSHYYSLIRTLAFASIDRIGNKRQTTTPIREEHVIFVRKEQQQTSSIIPRLGNTGDKLIALFSCFPCLPVDRVLASLM